MATTRGFLSTAVRPIVLGAALAAAAAVACGDNSNENPPNTNTGTGVDPCTGVSFAGNNGSTGGVAGRGTNHGTAGIGGAGGTSSGTAGVTGAGGTFVTTVDAGFTIGVPAIGPAICGGTGGAATANNGTRNKTAVGSGGSRTTGSGGY